jgi:peptidoglycan hydrolase CwlO-like protein
MDIPTAQKLDGDIKFLKTKTADQEKLINNATQDRALADKEIESLKAKESLMLKDIDILTKAKDDYKALYTKADAERLKATEDKPSRAAWFGWGVLTAVVLGTAAAFAISK